MFKSLPNIIEMSHVSRKSVKNDVISPKTGNIHSIEKYSKAKSSGKQKFAGVGKTIVLPNNVPRYKDEDNFNIKITQAHNNERKLISTIDNINLKIIEELLKNGDIKSSEIASNLAIPLSTIQRRRTKIEKTIVRKTYEMSLSQLGFRTALIFADVQKGKAKETGEKLLKRYDNYILRASTRINSSNNLCLEIIYANSEELHALLEEIKAMPLTTSVDWSEQVYPIGDNISSVVSFALTRKLKELETSKNN
jgi:DNA-binding Lrp family transcriptional regulator